MKTEEIKSRPDRCLIYYKLHGEKRSWAISAMPGKDNDETLRDHLKTFRPEAEYLGHKFSETEPDSWEQEHRSTYEPEEGKF